MSLVKAKILDEGKTLLSSSLAGYTRFAPHSYKLGTESGYEPLASDTFVRGLEVWSAPAELIQARIVEADTVRYLLTVPEGEGPFTFGNVILYANNFDGRPIPFIEVVLPFAITKPISDPNINNGNPFPKPGSRLVISITIRHSAIEGNEQLVVNVLLPSFSNLPYYEDEVSLPPPISQPWNQFIIHNHTRSGSPALVSRRSDSTYWATPFAQNVQHPHFGYIAGGIGGDGFQTNQDGWAFGYFYTTPDANYSGQVGGFTYEELLQYQPNIIGALPY